MSGIIHSTLSFYRHDLIFFVWYYNTSHPLSITTQPVLSVPPDSSLPIRVLCNPSFLLLIHSSTTQVYCLLTFRYHPKLLPFPSDVRPIIQPAKWLLGSRIYMSSSCIPLHNYLGTLIQWLTFSIPLFAFGYRYPWYIHLDIEIFYPGLHLYETLSCSCQ